MHAKISLQLLHEVILSCWTGLLFCIRRIFFSLLECHTTLLEFWRILSIFVFFFHVARVIGTVLFATLVRIFAVRNIYWLELIAFDLTALACFWNMCILQDELLGLTMMLGWRYWFATHQTVLACRSDNLVKVCTIIPLVRVRCLAIGLLTAL